MRRKLIVDGSSLWENPEDQFVLRFNDLNQLKQNKLAERLKQTSKRQRIRDENGPTIEEIVSLLKEINPIIHSEGSRRSYGSWTRWNIHNVHSLSGWYFRKLDQLIYRFLCLNRPPKYEEIKDALLLSCQNIFLADQAMSHGEQIRNILSRLPPENSETAVSAHPSELGINEVQSARERTERRNPQSFNLNN